MHRCPECGLACSCGGDIGDMILDADPAISCECCPYDEDDGEPWGTRDVCARCQTTPVEQDDSYSDLCDLCARAVRDGAP